MSSPHALPALSMDPSPRVHRSQTDPDCSLYAASPTSLRALFLAGLVAWPCLASAVEVDTTATLNAPPQRFSTLSNSPEGTETAAPPSNEATTGSIQTVDFERPTLLATWKGGPFTSHDLSATLALRRPPTASDIEPDQYKRISVQRWRNIVRDIIYELALHDRALQSGLTTATPELAPIFQDIRQSALNRIYFQEEIARRLPEAEDKLAREYYDNNRDTQFTRPERIGVTSLQVPTMDPVRVQEGETLASIAERVSGSAEERWNILRGYPPYAPRLPQGNARNLVPIVEVRAGEELLVPVNPAEKARRMEIAQQLRQQLLKGIPVTTAALSITSPQVRVAVEGQAYLPEFGGLPPAAESAIKELTSATSTVTPPIQGPWGIDLYVLNSRTTTTTLPFAEVESKIMEALRENDTYQRKLREDIRVMVFNDLRTTHNLEINTAALERPDYGGEDPLTGATWIIRTGNFTYTLEQYLKDLANQDRAWGALSAADRIEIAKSAPVVVRHLVTIECERIGLDRHPELLREVKSREIQELAKEFLKREAAKDTATTEGTLREYHARHIDRYTSSSMVTLREITSRFDPALPPAEKVQSIEQAKARLLALRPEASKSREDFERIARRQSAAISTRSRGGLVGTVPIGFRGPVVEAELKKLRPGEVTPPFVVGGEVVMYRLDDYVGGVAQPFEQVVHLVFRDYANEIPKQRQNQRKNEVLKQAGFKLEI